MFSIQNRNLSIAKLLLDKGANVNKKDFDGFSVVAIAIDSINLPMCELLLKFNPTIDNPQELLDILKANGNQKIFNIMKTFYFQQKREQVGKVK